MKNFLVILIILLAGLLVAQFLIVDKHDSSVRQTAVQQKTVLPDTPQNAAALRETEQGKDNAPAGKTMAGIDRERMIAPDQTRESDVSLSEYNIRHAQIYDAGEPANAADGTDQTQKSNVSQAQIDIVKKREAARQRRDQLLKMRAETIRTLDMEKGTDQQSAQ
jgi:hypothetical protein